MAFEKAFDQNLGTGQDVSEEDVDKILKERFNGAPGWETSFDIGPYVNQALEEFHLRTDDRIEGLFKEAFQAGMKYEDDLEVDFDEWFAAFVERLKNE